MNKNSQQSKSYYLLAVLLLITVISYFPVLKNQFVNWDDGPNVYQNEHIREINAKSLKGFFSSTDLNTYFPLVLVSYSLEYKIAKLHPFIYHLTNLLLHLLNVCLVFYLFKLLFKNKYVAVVISGLFALHPMNTEAVSWISARKDVLYVFFFLCSVIFYTKYIQNKKGKWNYLKAMLFFVLSLLSKSAAIILPFVLLLIDYLKGRKWSKKMVIDKIPFFILSFIFGLIAIYSQKSAQLINMDTHPFSFYEKILLFIYSFDFYLVRLFIPFPLCTFHPYPVKIANHLPMIFLHSPVLIIGLMAVCGWIIRKLKAESKRVFVFGILFFTLSIFPVLKIIPFGRDFIVAERFCYIPYLGLFTIVAYFCCKAFERQSINNRGIKTTITIIGAVYFILFIFIVHNRVGVWKNGITLFTDVIKKQPTASLGYYNRGVAFYNQGDINRAITDYTMAVKCRPDYAEAWYNRGNMKAELHNYSESINDYTEALKHDPKHYFAYNNRALARCYTNDLVNALNDFNSAIAIYPGFGVSYSNRALLKYNTMDYFGACQDWRKSLSLGYTPAESFLKKNCR